MDCYNNTDKNHKRITEEQGNKPPLTIAEFKAVVNELYKKKEITVSDDKQKKRWGGKAEHNAAYLPEYERSSFRIYNFQK